MASCLQDKATLYFKTLYHLYRLTSSQIISHSTLSIPTSSHSLISSQSKQQTAGSHRPCSHGDSAQGHSIGLDDLDLQGQTKGPIHSQSRDLDAGRAFCWTLLRLITSSQPSDINTSNHLEETCRTKRALVRVCWDVIGKDTTSARAIYFVYC